MENKELSKSLSWLLRHAVVDKGLNMDREGYVKIKDILKLEEFKKFTQKDIETTVEHSSKKRFSIKDNKIRANQGHSTEVAKFLDFTKILNPIENWEDIPICIHGTYAKLLPIIEKEGLSRRDRHAVHLCTGLDAVSGIRADCNTLIYIDTEKAIKDGLKFYRSDNDVVLCTGDETIKDSDGFSGVILPKYFKKIQRLR